MCEVTECWLSLKPMAVNTNLAAKLRCRGHVTTVLANGRPRQGDVEFETSIAWANTVGPVSNKTKTTKMKTNLKELPSHPTNCL